MAPYLIKLEFLVSQRKSNFYDGKVAVIKIGAGDGARTRHLSLGKAALYQMSYSRREPKLFLVRAKGLEPIRLSGTRT